MYIIIHVHIAFYGSTKWKKTRFIKSPYFLFLVYYTFLLLGGELLAESCRPPQSFSAKWFLDARRVSSSQMVGVVRQR